MSDEAEEMDYLHLKVGQTILMDNGELAVVTNAEMNESMEIELEDGWSVDLGHVLAIKCGDLWIIQLDFMREVLKDRSYDA